MRLYVLTPDLSRTVALAPDLSMALATEAWAGLVLAWSDGVPGPDGSAPSPAYPVDRANPSGPPRPGVVTVAKLDFFRRCTEDEAGRILAALDATSSRMQSIFGSAQNFKSDAEEWPLLHDAAVGLFGADRAAELLAPSSS